MARLPLPTVTLCAVTSVNLEATREALRCTLSHVAPARTLLLTDLATPSGDGIEVVAIDRLGSAADYSRFIVHRLADHVATDHVLIVQWDGFVIDPAAWSEAFLAVDYVGAVWPQFRSDRVGNGGFSLRSRRLLEACRTLDLLPGEAEDIAIGRRHRAALEAQGMVFADEPLARRFSFERERRGRQPRFGFHGVFNMIEVIGRDAFWRTYRTLDRPESAFHDFWWIWWALGGIGRRLRFLRDRFAAR